MAAAAKTLFVHIGSEKTGSKSIQRSLARSARHLLRRYGVLYPRHRRLLLGDAHYPILSPLIEARQLDFVPSRARLTRDELRDALASSGAGEARTMVLSAEHLSSRLRPTQIDALRDILVSALPGHRVRIIYHVRSQTSQYCAALSTHLKSLGITIRPAAGIPSADRFFNHFRVAADWAETFGRENVLIGNYHGADALSLFYRSLGIEAADANIYRPAQRNPSLTREMADIVFAINQAFGPPDFGDEDLIRVRRHVQGSLIYYLNVTLASRTPLHSILSADDRAHFRREFADSNDRLQDAFGLDFNLNDHMEDGAEAPPAEARPRDEEAFREELAYWKRIVGDAPLSPADARTVAKRLRAVLVGRHLKRLVKAPGGPVQVWRELAERF